MEGRGFFVVAAASVLAALAMLLPRRASGMTSVEYQDTSDVPRAADFNASINLPERAQAAQASGEWPAYVPPGIPDEAAVAALSPVQNDFPVMPAFDGSWDSPGAFVGPIQDDPYTPWEDGWPTGVPAYVPFEENFPMQQALTPQPVLSPEPFGNLAAFLYMIRCCEHLLANVKSDACYGIFYSGVAGFNAPEFLNQRFTNYADHPVATGACRKVPLPAQVCLNAGLSAGCGSTAAGAYQIILPTWQEVRKMAPALPDFSPASQDEAAIRLLMKRGAFEPLLNGDFDTALERASKEWASLPGSSAKQNPKQRIYAIDRFNEYSGRVG